MGAPRPRADGRAIAIITIAIVLGCAGGPTLRDGVYRDRRQGWSIAAPPADWTQVSVDGADLAFRGPDAASIAATSRCDVAVVALDVLARQLRAGLGAQEVLEERDVVVAGRPARMQVLALPDGARVRAVTRAAAPCVQDFVLVALRDFAASAAVFDAWWATFAPSAEPAP
jgi:hypothetical protein